MPHEVTHAIFATFFGHRLPRWAEEGACVCAEHEAERGDLDHLGPSQWDVGTVMTLEQMFAVREYPTANALPLYAQGYSFVRFLLASGGKRKFVEFLSTGMRGANWPRAAEIHYGHSTLPDLQKAWMHWAVRTVPRTPPDVANSSN